MVGKPEINNLDILNSLALANEWSCALEYLINFFLSEHHHDILRLQIPVDNIKIVNIHCSLYYIPNYKGTLKLV